MIYTHLAAGIVGALIAATSAWQVQNWRYGTQISEMASQYAKAQAEAAAKNEAAVAEYNSRLQKAQNAATQKETVLRRDAAAARRERDGLRDELASARSQFASSTRASVVERAAALSDIFEHCVREYSDLADKADRHAIDAGKLWNGWPVNTPTIAP